MFKNRAIPCQGPPELVNGNLILKEFFDKMSPETLKFVFPKNVLIIFINYVFFFVYKRIKVLLVPDVTLSNITVNL